MIRSIALVGRILLAVTVCLISVVQALAETQDNPVAYEIASANVLIVGEIDPETGLELIGELERFRAAVLSVYGVDPSVRDRRLEIYIVSDPSLYATLRLDEGFVAIYGSTFAGPRALVNGAALDGDADILRLSLRHEFAHHLNRYHGRTALPRWLNEGLAEYFSAYEETADGRYRLGLDQAINQYIMSESDTDHLRSAEEMLNSFASIPRAQRHLGYAWDSTLQFYAQSWAMVRHAMQSEDGLDRLAQLADATGAPEIDALALTETYEDYQEHINRPSPFEGLLLANLAPDAADYKAYLGMLQRGANDSAIRDGPIDPSALAADVSVRALTETEAAARHYHLLVMTAKSPSINKRLIELREQIEADPVLAADRLVSQAALELSMGSYGLAPDTIEKALELDPNAFEGREISLFVQLATFTNFNYQHAESMRATLRPWLSDYPNDPDLLVMMAQTGTDPEKASAESEAALATLEQDGVLIRRPELGLMLISHALRREDYETVLDRVRRGKIYVASGERWHLDSLERDTLEMIAYLESDEAQ